MLEILKAIWELLKGHGEEEIAKISAYVLAPGLLFGLSISGAFFHGGFTSDFERPIAISELKTEVLLDGTLQSRNGVVLIAEPVSSEYGIQLGTGGGSKVWSSLDKEAMQMNLDRFVVDNGGGLRGKTPFVGVTNPVAIVVDGELGKNIQVPGGVERVEDWLLHSRRSNSLVTSVMFAWVFALGMSLTIGLPSVERSKETTR